MSWCVIASSHQCIDRYVCLQNRCIYMCKPRQCTSKRLHNAHYSASVGMQVANAAKHWDGTGAMVYTGSTGVYPAASGVCTEDSALVAPGTSERTDRLLKAEQAMLEAGGNVVRLVGLYHSSRGPHVAFLRMGESQMCGASIMNLLHYEDAASLAVAVRYYFVGVNALRRTIPSARLHRCLTS